MGLGEAEVGHSGWCWEWIGIGDRCEENITLRRLPWRLRIQRSVYKVTGLRAGVSGRMCVVAVAAVVVRRL